MRTDTDQASQVSMDAYPYLRDSSDSIASCYDT